MHPTRLLLHLNLANQLTFLRLVAVPFFIIAILQSRLGLALVLFVTAALTDLLDGLIARYLRQQTAFGAYLDPLADKLMLTTAFILLTEYPALFKGLALTSRLPIWLTTLTISRDVLIVVVALGLFLAHRQTRFLPSVLGKLTTAAELATVSFFLLFNWLGRVSWWLDVWVWIALVLTLLSGFQYLMRTIRMLNADAPDRRP